VLSPWSEKWSFTTGLDPVTNNLKLESPSPGAINVPVEPLFQWTGIIGANAYELIVAKDPEFTDPVINHTGGKILPSNAWQSDIILEYETAYYWKVRAVNGDTKSAWSATGSFKTMAEPVATGMVAEVTLTSPAETPNPNSSQFQPSFTTPASNQQSPPLPPASTANTGQSSVPTWVIYLIGAQVVMISIALVVILLLVVRIKRSR